MSTSAYVDLMFAWGHARLGDADTAQRLFAQAAELLYPMADTATPYPPVDPIHAWLLDAFRFRIEEATAGHPSGGPWSAELVRRLDASDRARPASQFSHWYVVDRFRAVSRILEPVEEINPYAGWTPFRRYGAAVRWLIRPPLLDQLPARVQEFCDRLSQEADVLDQLEAHRTLLAQEEITGNEVGTEVAGRARTLVLSCLDRRWADDADVAALFTRHRPSPGPAARPEEHADYQTAAASPGRWVEQTIYIHAGSLHRSMLGLAGRMGWRELVAVLVDDVLRRPDVLHIDRAWLDGSRRDLPKVLLRLDMRTEAARLAEQRRGVELAAYRESGRADQLELCLSNAALDLWLGRPEVATEVLDLACRDLRRFDRPAIAAGVIRQYLEALAYLDWSDRRPRLEAILNVLPPMPNGYTTATHYSRLHIEIADRAVLAVVLPRPGGPATAADVHRASRREVLGELRAKLVEWGRPDWGPRPAKSQRARPGHADAS